LQKQLFLVQLLVWVAGWLWAFYNQEQTKQQFFDLLLKAHIEAYVDSSSGVFCSATIALPPIKSAEIGGSVCLSVWFCFLIACWCCWLSRVLLQELGLFWRINHSEAKLIQVQPSEEALRRGFTIS